MSQAKPGGELAGGCPMGYGGGKGKGKAAENDEPADSGDRPLPEGTVPELTRDTYMNPGEEAPPSLIPATGRGNSEDGQSWVSPSPFQLHRALKRKGKAIAKEDSFDVSHVHELVVNGTWDAIMEFEELHKNMCPNPRLARFEGKDGIYSMKAKFFNMIGIDLPFDRHDWTVDRCGTEVKYVIDYYSMGDDLYTIDARPLGAEGMFDRMRIAAKKIFEGESPW